jgi:YD repeat-containing protein
VISDYDYTYDAAGSRLTTTTSAGVTSYQYEVTS